VPPEEATRLRHAEPAIRQATGRDVRVIVKLAAEHAEYERTRAQPDDRSLAAALDGMPPRLRVWLAEDGRDPLGYAAVTEDFSTWRAEPFLHLDCLYVREMHRHRGVGSALFRQVERYAHAQGVRTLEWQTPLWNKDALLFYERMGGHSSIKARFSMAVKACDSR
jgi:GNAT superfamily N-acetyltransferase